MMRCLRTLSFQAIGTVVLPAAHRSASALRQTAAEATWPKQTDVDKLERASNALEASGLVALHHASNTQGDGWDDARESLDARGGMASGVHGAVFYHGQDVDCVIDDGVLYLAYGALPKSTVSEAGIVARVVAALKAEGFNVTAPPDATQRITITGIDWKNRSPG